MLNFPENVGRETRMRFAADWLSERMQAEPTAYSPAGKGQPPIERKPPEEDPDGERRRALRRCQRACDGDERRRIRYCNRLPDRRLRGACWAIVTASKFACRGWCYNEFGD